jgi:hypothetical protein
MSKSEYSADKALELAKYINNIKELRGLGLNQLALLANMDSAALHKISTKIKRDINCSSTINVIESMYFEDDNEDYNEN